MQHRWERCGIQQRPEKKTVTACLNPFYCVTYCMDPTLDMEELFHELIDRAEAEGGVEWLRRCLHDAPRTSQAKTGSSGPDVAAGEGTSAVAVNTARRARDRRAGGKRRQKTDRPCSPSPAPVKRGRNLAPSAASLQSLQEQRTVQHEEPQAMPVSGDSVINEAAGLVTSYKTKKKK